MAHQFPHPILRRQSQSVPAQSQDAFRPLLLRATNLAALSDPASSSTQPPTIGATVAANDAARLTAGNMAFEMDGHTAALLGFSLSDGANETARVRVFRIRYKADDITGADTNAFVYEIAADLTITAGSETLADSALGTSTDLWADTITQNTPYPGVYVLPGIANHVKHVVIESAGAHLLYVQVQNQTSTTCSVWYQPSDSAVGLYLSALMDRLGTNEGAPDIDGSQQAQLTYLNMRVRELIYNSDPTMKGNSGVELNCIAASTDYTVTGLTAGNIYQATAENGTIYLGLADTTDDGEKVVTVTAGSTQRIALPTGFTTLHYSTEDGAGVIGRLSEAGYKSSALTAASPSTTPTSSSSSTASTTPTTSASSTPSSTSSSTASTTPTTSASGTPSSTSSSTASSSPSNTASTTPTTSPSSTVSSTPTTSPSDTTSATETASPSSTSSTTATQSPSTTPTASSSASGSSSPSATSTSSPSSTVSATPTTSASSTASTTPTSSPSGTSSSTASSSPSSTPSSQE